MSLNLPPRCWRRRSDCEPLGAVDAPPDGVTEEQFLAFEYDPHSFVCFGCVDAGSRGLPQDAYRLCWKNPVVDEMGDYDEQDVAHTMLVMAQGMAVVATRRVNRGMVEVPTRQGDIGAGPPWDRGREPAQGEGDTPDEGSGAGLPG